MQVKDIDKITVVKRLSEIQNAGRSGTIFNGFENSIFSDDTSEKLALSVMKNLVKSGLVTGCCCGCRGDFELTDKGYQALRRNIEEAG